jgi:ubiquinol-cytochrome c reductase cytochrome c subunit
MRLLRRWWARPPRTPRWVRGSLAAVLTTTALFGIIAPSSGEATTATASGPLTAQGGAPSASPNAPSKRPEPPGAGNPTSSFPNSPALRSEGQTLFDNGCSSCHGLNLEGRHDIAPSLYNVGAGPVDFYLSTGRMPLQNPTDEPEAAKPAYSPRQIDALIDYVVSVGGGPDAPAVQVDQGNLSQGFSLFTEHCAGCHQIVGRGGVVVGAYVPALQDATPLQVGEAVRMGPYLMPHFDAHQINQQQLDSLAKYVLYTRHPKNSGGWGIYNIGPIPEGIAAWFIALLALVIVARLIGERTGGEIR